MKIIEKIRKKIAEEKADPTGAVADDVRKKSVAAIFGGVASKDWATYMQMFADTPEQLARLKAQDAAQNDPYMKTALAYLVSNGTCGASTITRLEENINPDLLDQGLPPQQP